MFHQKYVINLLQTHNIVHRTFGGKKLLKDARSVKTYTRQDIQEKGHWRITLTRNCLINMILKPF